MVIGQQELATNKTVSTSENSFIEKQVSKRSSFSLKGKMAKRVNCQKGKLPQNQSCSIVREGGGDEKRIYLQIYTSQSLKCSLCHGP